jgi:hypothetical protein
LPKSEVYGGVDIPAIPELDTSLEVVLPHPKTSTNRSLARRDRGDVRASLHGATYRKVGRCVGSDEPVGLNTRGKMKELILDTITVEGYTFYLRTMQYTRHTTEEIPISREAVIIWASQVLRRPVDFPEAKKAFMCWIKALARNNMKYKDGVKFMRMFTFI